MGSKLLLKNIFSVGIIQIANYIFPLITVPIVSRIIGPEKFGVVNFASAFIVYFTLFIGYGFDITAVRKVAVDPTNNRNVSIIFSEVFQSQILLLIVSIVFFLVFLFSVPQLREEKLVAIFTFLTCFASVITQNWLFQAMQDLSKIAVLSLVSKVLFTVLILVLIHKKRDYIWQPFALSFSSIFIAVITFIWSIKRYKIKLQMISIKTCLKLLWDEKTFFISMIVVNFYTTTNIVILGLLQNPTQVGFYAAGQRIVVIFQSIISVTLTQAFFPYVGKAFGQGFDKGFNTAKKLLPIVLLFTFLASFCFFIVGPIILNFLYGAAFAPSVGVFRVLIFTPVIISFSTVLGIHIMLNLKMDKLFLQICSIGAVISLTLNLLFVKKFGFMASAVILVVTELTIAIFFYFSLKKKGMNIFDKNFFSIKSLKEVAFSTLRKNI